MLQVGYKQNPGEKHWIEVKNIFKYSTRAKDVFLICGGDELKVYEYIDASF